MIVSNNNYYYINNDNKSIILSDEDKWYIEIDKKNKQVEEWIAPHHSTVIKINGVKLSSIQNVVFTNNIRQQFINLNNSFTSDAHTSTNYNNLNMAISNLRAVNNSLANVIASQNAYSVSISFSKFISSICIKC